MIKFLLRISFVFATLLVFVPKGQAQNLNNSRINQFSDQQVMQLWQQASENGLSETDAMKMLVKKGLKPSEVSQFKKRLVGLQTSKKSQFSKSNLIQDTTSFLRDSTWVLEVPDIRKQSKSYGYEFFSSPNISFEPNLRIATPKTYVLGPDDQLNVTLTGLNEILISVLVALANLVRVRMEGREVPLSSLAMDDWDVSIFLANSSCDKPELILV